MSNKDWLNKFIEEKKGGTNKSSKIDKIKKLINPINLTFYRKFNKEESLAIYLGGIIKDIKEIVNK